MDGFKLSEGIDKNKVFIMNRSELDDRFDPIYYNMVSDLFILNNTKFEVKKLGEIANFQRGRFGHRPRNDPRFFGGKYPFVQTGNIVEASVSNGKVKYSQTLNELGLSTSRLFPADTLVITIAANIGSTAIIDYEACFPDSLLALIPKEENYVSKKYLNFYLRIIKDYIESLAPQAAQKNINNKQLYKIGVPIPPLTIQHKIVEIMENANYEKEKKEKEAQQLLDSIDDYLLSELGISLPSEEPEESELKLVAEARAGYGSKIGFELDKENVLVKNGRIFLTDYSDIEGRRWDAFEVINRNKKIDGGKFQNKKLKNIATLIKGQSITSEKIIEGEIPVIAGGQTSPYSHNQSNFEGNVITVSASGAYSGFVWFHDYPIFASDCTVIFSKNENEISTPFLAEILKLKQREIYNLQQGAGQPHVYSKDLALLNIPIPAIENQSEILQHIFEIRKSAEYLREEATLLLEKSKTNVEQMILG